MDELLIIGDVHASQTNDKFDRYQSILELYPNAKSIQVGDFGFQWAHRKHLKEIDNTKHKINFGNHDCTDYLHELHSTGNYTYLPDWNLCTFRGASSIDRSNRLEGVTWWHDEEMSYAELQDGIDFIITMKPDIIVSHDIPQSVLRNMFDHFPETSRTRQALDILFNEYQPKFWFFGHYHQNKILTVNKCVFQCIAELNYIKLTK